MKPGEDKFPGFILVVMQSCEVATPVYATD
jgi:hypothetical protein